jgi:hypothetical protein
VSTYDTREWKTAFLDYYNQLYGDPSNNFKDQAIKLASLEQECRDTERICVPSFLVRQCLAKCRLKTKSAPGPDSITWRALSLLSDACVESLARLFEHRINGDEGHREQIQL